MYNMPIYDRILNDYPPLDYFFLRILGQPGIGKSMFAVAIMKRMMSQNNSFIYTDLGKAYVYGWSLESGAFVNTSIYDALRTGGPTTLWIMNEKEHGPFLDVTNSIVLLASLMEHNYKDLAKVRGEEMRTLYMPLPSVEDIHHMVSAANPQLLLLTEQEVNRRIAIVGRIPRYVKTRRFEEVVREIKCAIEHCTFNAEIFNSTDIFSGGANRLLFAIDADNNFVFNGNLFPSEFIEELYMKNWAKKKLVTFKQFIATNNYTGIGTVYGSAFKSFAHLKVAGGGDFRIRMLTEKGDVKSQKNNESLKIAHRQVTLVDNNNVVFDVSMINQYLQPHSHNFGAVDSMVLLRDRDAAALYHMTVDPNHGINGPALAALIDTISNFLKKRPSRSAVKTQIAIRFVFVVPTYMFNDFKAQSFTHGGIDEKYVNMIEQYVLGVETVE